MAAAHRAGHTQNEKFLCTACSNRVDTTKRILMASVPKVGARPPGRGLNRAGSQVLCLHLKRFRWTEMDKGKVEMPVQFPLRDLDVTRFVHPAHLEPPDRRLTYDLVGIITHHGRWVEPVAAA